MSVPIASAPIALDPSTVTFDGPDCQHSIKTLADVAQIFADASGVDPATLLYSVDSFTQGDPSIPGHLNVGMTTLQPVTINGEYTMTRGHIHADRDAAEIYVGVEGTGLLLLDDLVGDVRVERVEPGSVHHIQGHQAHRLVNDSDAVLKVFAVWPTTAGYDYAAVEDAGGFGVRVFAGQGIINADSVDV